MRRLIQTMVVVMLFLVLLTGPAMALEWAKLRVQEAALHGATHVVVITHDDLTEAGTNTAQTITNAFPVLNKVGVGLVKMELRQAFEDSDVAAFNSVTVIVGDGNDTDRYLASTELNENGTEVWAKFGRSVWQSTMTLTNMGEHGLADVVAVTNVAHLGQNVYTAADSVDFIFTPLPVSYALSALDKGEIRFYFRVIDPRYQ